MGRTLARPGSTSRASHPRPRVAVTSAALLTLLVAAACTEEGPDEQAQPKETAEPDPEPAPAPEREDAPEEVATPAAIGSTEYVQDLLVYERFEVIGADGEVSDRIDDLLDHLDTHTTRAVELPHAATFAIAEDLDATVLRPDGSQRDDVATVVGVLNFGEARAPALLATPLAGAATIGLQDEVRFDLTPVDGLDVGDVIVFDLAFLQAFPAEAPERRAQEEGLDPVALFTHRLEQEQVAYYGRTDPDTGAPVALSFTDQVGRVVDGSRGGQLPAKASDMTDGMEEGLDDCGKPLNCVKEWFEEFGEGARDSFNNALCNGGIGSNCPPRDPPPPPDPYCFSPPCGNSRGEPHLLTFDGVHYSFQAVGEFVLTRGEDLEVQARFLPWANSEQVSVAVGAAIAADGIRLTVQLEDREPVLRVEGERVDWFDLADTLGERGVQATMYPGTLVQVTTSAGHVVSIPIRLRTDSIDVFVDIASTDGAREGLLGTNDGDDATDFVTADGEVLTSPPAPEERYGVFADSWRVSDATSLFDYRDGESTETFTDRDLPRDGGADAALLEEQDPAAVARARGVCERVGIADQRIVDECILDVAVTGDPGFAVSAQTADRSQRIASGALPLERAAPWRSDAPGDAPDTADIPDEIIDIDWNTTLHFQMEEFGLTDGDRLALRCPTAPDRPGLRVFGTDVYWTSSDVCASAVHAGVADVLSGGTFVIEFEESVAHFDTEVVERNGIDPRQWSRRGPGFRFVR